MKEVKCGIYEIRNVQNNKIYIGQSQDIFCRWKQHKYELKTEKHHNIHLQKSWNKYGGENFEFSIIEECDLKTMDDREVYWIQTLKTRDKTRGYNISIGGKALDNSKKNISFNVVDTLDKMVNFSHVKRGFFFNMCLYLNPKENCLWHNKKYLTQKNLMNLLGYKKSQYINELLGQLENANLIKRVKNGKSKIIYINPNYCYLSHIDKIDEFTKNLFKEEEISE